MKIETTAKPFDLDVKRFYLPGTRLVGECPNCHHPHTEDLGSDYLSYPRANEPFDHTCYCGECDHEWTIRVRLDVVLTVV